MLRSIEGDPGPGVIAATEKRQALGVVPVQVPEQYGAPVRLSSEESGEAAYAGAGVDDEGEAASVVGEGEGRGVASVTEVLRSRCRCRAPGS